MAIFSSLKPAEQARQLLNPEGSVGIEVAEWLNGNNRESNAQTLALLGVQAGHHVLEIGFGNGRAAPEVLSQAPGIQYTGIDISPTMLDEAKRFNAELIAAGRASFHLTSAEHMPFADASFDRVLSTGVIHFWKDALVPLHEVHRVMRPGGLTIMTALDSRSQRPFARPEFGFYLRGTDEWATLCRQAGFATLDVQNCESERLTLDGKPTKQSSVRVMAWR
jgi:ubiquinone/menaquinone biosynthesis C-methylase UbiE